MVNNNSKTHWKLINQRTTYIWGSLLVNSRHPDPRRVLGRCRAAVRGQDPLDPRDPRMESFLRVLGIKNNENENPISKLSIWQCCLLVCVIDFSFLRCFAMNLDADFSKHCANVICGDERAVFYNDFGCIFAQKMLRRPSEAVEVCISSWGCHGVVMGLSWGWSRPPQPPRAAGAAFEQLLSKSASKIVVKHCKNEKTKQNTITQTNTQHSKIDKLEIGFSFSLFFMPKTRKNEPIRGFPRIQRILSTDCRSAPPVHMRRVSGWR